MLSSKLIIWSLVVDNDLDRLRFTQCIHIFPRIKNKFFHIECANSLFLMFFNQQIICNDYKITKKKKSEAV